MNGLVSCRVELTYFPNEEKCLFRMPLCPALDSPEEVAIDRRWGKNALETLETAN